MGCGHCALLVHFLNLFFLQLAILGTMVCGDMPDLCGELLPVSEPLLHWCDLGFLRWPLALAS